MGSREARESQRNKRQRCLDVIAKDPSIDIQALAERFGVDIDTAMRWRSETQSKRNYKSRRNSHRRPSRRPRRLL